jgi:hypothetical protein
MSSYSGSTLTLETYANPPTHKLLTLIAALTSYWPLSKTIYSVFDAVVPSISPKISTFTFTSIYFGTGEDAVTVT